jgi:hypothetical protein
MVYQFTTGAAQTLTFDGGSADVSADAYSGCLIFRGASEVGVGDGVDSNSTGTTLTMPSLTIDRVPATVIVFSFFGNSITATPAGWITTNGMAYAEYLTTWSGGNFTLSDTAALIGTTVPIY